MYMYCEKKTYFWLEAYEKIMMELDEDVDVTEAGWLMILLIDLLDSDG